MQKKCEKCGRVLSDSERICPVCGTAVTVLSKENNDTADDYSGYVYAEADVVRDEPRRGLTLSTLILATVVLGILIAAAVMFLRSSPACAKPMEYSPDLGYYKYSNIYYYKQGGSWYQYDAALGWVMADPSESFLENYNSYYEGRALVEEYAVPDFRNSDYYDSSAGLNERISNGENNSLDPGNGGMENGERANGVADW